jgi:hypothetical protein
LIQHINYLMGSLTAEWWFRNHFLLSSKGIWMLLLNYLPSINRVLRRYINATRILIRNVVSLHFFFFSFGKIYCISIWCSDVSKHKYHMGQFSFVCLFNGEKCNSLPFREIFALFLWLFHPLLSISCSSQSPINQVLAIGLFFLIFLTSIILSFFLFVLFAGRFLKLYISWVFIFIYHVFEY